MEALIQKLESYNWTDELGHPLVNCVEWDAIKRNLLFLERFHESIESNKAMAKPE